MITSIAWIPKGSARLRPMKYEFSPEEVNRIKEMAEENLIEDNSNSSINPENELASPIKETSDKQEIVDDLPPEFRMDEYDSDDEVDDNNIEELNDVMEELEITEESGKAYAMDDESDADDEEDNQLRPTDALLIAAVTEDECSHLEVHVFTEEGNLYIHHDIMLSEFPLCVAWCDCPPYLSNGVQNNIGNYAAVGTFDPAIEIWNLDVLDPLEPSAVLGGRDLTKKSKKKVALKPESHQDSVLCLNWNRNYRQAMASGSADKTVKIWDITTQQCYHTFTHHTDKVQGIQFHPFDSWLLSTGAFDKSICLIDCRSGSVDGTYTVNADPEAMAWNPFNRDELFCSLEDGQVVCFDRRKPDHWLYSFKAHDKTASSLSFSQSIPGMLATASVDKAVRIWDVQSAGSSTAPKLVAYKSLSAGKLFTLQFYQDSPFVLAAGGDKGMVAVWESDETNEIERAFSNRIVDRAAGFQYSNPIDIDNAVAKSVDVDELVDESATQQFAINEANDKEISKKKKKSKDKKKKH